MECFKVFYTKDIKKKRKVYNEGVISINGRRIQLFNEQGQSILVTTQKNKPIIGEQYLLKYTYLVTVEQEISRQRFTTGEIFMVDKLINNKKKFNNKCSIKTNSKKLESGLVMEESLYHKLRPHQIQGVNFMYECVIGNKGQFITGCILADFMGLGKTLQTLALTYSMLRSNIIKKSIVVCPLTLVNVWKKQCQKWLDNKLIPFVCMGIGSEVLKSAKQFSSGQYRMLIISYESFFKTINILNGRCDLIVFDEGHRLKNRKSKMLKKLLTFQCKKRILLTGTPLQNNLQQLYTCISIVNPLMFDNQNLFRNVFEKPILAGMAQNATSEDKQLAKSRTAQLAGRIKQFSLRRKAQILQKYLPQRNQMLVFLKLTPLQKLWYDRIILKSIKQNTNDVMTVLNQLRKLFIHPNVLKNELIYKGVWQDYSQSAVYQDSYKISFTLSILEQCLRVRQKLIIVSYFTENLDLIASILKERNISFSQLDGSIDGKKRFEIVESFRRQRDVLLLSGKAGGTGLTLTCSCKMVMLEPDWNPSNDTQVMGRIWRQGQQKIVSIYRLIITSSFQQKILQRQHFKQLLSQRLIDQRLQTKQQVDFINLKKLFIENFQKCLTYSDKDNYLNQFIKQNQGIPCQGIIHIQLLKSNTKNIQNINKNEFEEAIFLNQKQSELDDQEEEIIEQEEQQNTKIRKNIYNPKQKIQDLKNNNNELQPKQNCKVQEQQQKQLVTLFINHEDKDTQIQQNIIVKRSKKKIDIQDDHPLLNKIRKLKPNRIQE